MRKGKAEDAAVAAVAAVAAHLGVVKNDKSDGGDVPKSVRTCHVTDGQTCNTTGMAASTGTAAARTVSRNLNAVAGGMLGTRVSNSGPV